MSSHIIPEKKGGSASRPMTVPRFVAAKSKGCKLSMLTAYDHQFAKIFDSAGIDSLLVGDSLGMVVQGRSTTLPVKLEDVIYHGEIVARSVEHALVIIDMPFMTYQVSSQQAVENAGRILKETGASAVKIEGGTTQANTIQALGNAGIPVMAHVGMRPQSVNQFGGMGKVQRDARELVADARAAEEAGAFSIVLELIPQNIAKVITDELSIPTIGIGAGPHCDGQVLVSNDMLGMTEEFHPRFLKCYAELAKTIRSATKAYIEEVTHGDYPTTEHSHD